MKIIELLAPAKDKQTAFAAINSGCDALYIGASNFGARKKVCNSLDDIKEVVNYAHKFYVKVFVTLNTILTDNELFEAQKLIWDLYEIGIDAIIIQDMGILKLAVDGKLPPILLHASTQCDNRNVEKVKFFQNLGLARVIIARELSLKQIEEICNKTDVEIETFIHGALCVSYSGQCYLSSYIGGRSANRGECAQACRKKYSLVDENGNYIAKDKYLLSMKDFNASEHIEALIKAGVKSFKIEGRLKDENYVKNVVSYYRRKIDKFALKSSSGKIFTSFKPNLKKSFNRGFTDYFLEGRKKCFNFTTPKSIGEKLGIIDKIGKNWFSIKNLNVELHNQDGLFFENGGCLINKVEQNKIYPNKMNGLHPGIEVYRNFDIEFEKQLVNPKRKIGVKLIYNEGILHAIDEDNNAVEFKLSSNEPSKNPQKMRENFMKQLQKTGESDFYITEIILQDDLNFLSISQINEVRRKILSSLIEKRLKNYPRKLQKPLKYVKYPLEKVDYRANVHNVYAKEFYENCDCKVCEMSFESKIPGKAELMRTKHCLKFAFNMCKSPQKLFLIDEKGQRFPLNFDCKNCEMIIDFCKNTLK